MNKNKKIKIFFFNPYPAIGGVDTIIKKFINSLDLRYYDIEYITLKKINKKFNNKINYKYINSNSTFLSYFKIYKILKKDISKKKIFFSIQYFSNIWSILFLKKLKKVKLFLYEVNHLNELSTYNNFSEFIKKNIIKFFVKKLYIKADLIAGNSKELSLDLSKFTNKKVYTLYNPCFFRIKRSKIVNKFTNNIKILNVSRLENQKDHFTLLKAIRFSKIKNKIQLIFVGDGANKNKILQFINKYKIKAKIYSNHTKLNVFYSTSDLFVSSSLYEGLPTTMVEAASYHLPIISSNFKSGSKEILSNGRGGFIFKIKDYQHLAKLIEQFYFSPKLFFKKAKYCSRVIKKFSYKKNIYLFHKLLKLL